jgi:integrase
MPVHRITKRVVEAIEAKDKDVFVWDSELRGFGIRAWPTGRKTYVIQYRMPGLGRSSFAKRISLGEHGTLTPDEARKLARRELARVAHGENPAADRAKARAADSVEELGVAYLKEAVRRRKPRTAAEYERLWNKHILPAIGSRRVPQISPSEVRKLHASMSGTPYLANRVAALLAAFFTYAEREGAGPPEGNPVRGIEFYPESSRERFLTREEFARLGRALRAAETTGLAPAPKHQEATKREDKKKHRPKKADTPTKANPFAVAAIRLLALTGCRENEILTLRWDAVDLERGYLRLKDTKTGKSVRALGESAAELLAQLPRIEGNAHVLPGHKDGDHLKEIRRVWEAVRFAAKLEAVRLHDLRHSYASVPAASGESLLVIQSLLGHTDIATTGRYAHLGDDPVKRAATKTAADIASWMEDQNPIMTPID